MPYLYRYSDRKTLETLGQAKPDKPWIQGEHVSSQTGVVAIGEHISDGCVVEYVLHIGREYQIAIGVFYDDGQIQIVPRLQLIVLGVVDTGVAFILPLVVAAHGHVPSIQIKDILCAEVKR